MATFFKKKTWGNLRTHFSCHSIHLHMTFVLANLTELIPQLCGPKGFLSCCAFAKHFPVSKQVLIPICISDVLLYNLLVFSFTHVLFWSPHFFNHPCSAPPTQHFQDVPARRVFPTHHASDQRIRRRHNPEYDLQPVRDLLQYLEDHPTY